MKPAFFWQAFLVAWPLAAQDKVKPPSAKEVQIQVDAAIDKGVAYLKKQVAGLKPFSWIGKIQYDELLLWTLLHAGVPESDTDFQKLFKEMLERPLERTYAVALQAMVLEEVERVKYQARIAQCAQFLVDNQCADGSWFYGTRVLSADAPPSTPSEAPRKDVASRGEAKNGAVVSRKPAVLSKITVKKTRDAPGSGDNSNSQYAALGLRACFEAGIVLPDEVLNRAVKWWREHQKKPEGNEELLRLERPAARSSTRATVEGAVAAPRGWCYEGFSLKNGKHAEHKGYGSMTAGGVGSLCIYKYIQEGPNSWRQDKNIQEGLQWLSKSFSVTSNPGPQEPEHKLGPNALMYHYYHLYALERACMLYGTEVLGASRWYPEGVRALLPLQKPDGSWQSPVREGDLNAISDTCFAILFLRRATRPLEPVASRDPLHKKP